MSGKENLQKAIEATIAAGYQLNSEAFEFLNQTSETTDPVDVMNLALQQLELLQEKPFFIDRVFLEALVQKLTATAVDAQAQEQPNPAEQTHTSEAEQVNAAENAFYPYAKDIRSSLTIIEDSTGKLSSNGTLEEYVEYFQDRFKRIERLLRQRMDVKAATPILEALKSQPKTKLKIICMITEKRESKNNMILSVEDLQGSTTILVPQRAQDEVKKRALLLLPDQVVCFAVIKTRTNLFLAEDIIFPEIGRKTPQRAQEPVYAVFTSDIHVGSKKFEKEAFKRFILWLQGKFGDARMKEIAGYVKYVLIAGDTVDGVGIYPGQSNELAIKDIYTQYKALASYIRRIPQYIEVLIIPGDHDAAPKILPQPALSGKYVGELCKSSRVHLLPDPCLVSIHGVEVLMYHGRSLIDIASNVPGISLNEAYKAMRILLQSRHLAPSYGQRTLVMPTPHDYLVIERVPDILHTGHLHLLKHESYRGVIMINSGCWQGQTEYQEKNGISPIHNIITVVNLQTMEILNLDFN